MTHWHNILVVTSLTLAPLAALDAGETPAAAGKPNIVFIIADDMFAEMFNFRPEGRGKNLTPNLDRLAAEGTILQGQHIVSPVCTPSRYNCLTGRYASRARNPQFTNLTERAGMSLVLWNCQITPEDTTLPQLLQRTGYVTGFAGKQHVVAVPGRTKLPPDADPRDPEVRKELAENERAERAALQRAGFDEAAGIYPGNPDDLGPAALRVHNMDWVAQAGLDFIDRHAGQGKPFFLYFAPTLVHSPYTPERSWDADPLVTPAGLLDAPPDVLPSRASRSQRLRESPTTGRHRENLLWLDDALGALRQKLESTGQLAKTVIFFFNDNGQNGKGSLYQSGAFAPSIVWRQGGFPCGQTASVRVTNLDFAPTILDLAGGSAPPDTFDGRSFRAALDGDTEAIHESLYFELGFTRGVLQGDWKYIALRYPPDAERFALSKDRKHMAGVPVPPGNPGFGHIAGNNNESNALRTQPAYFDRDQLYDLKTDPREQRNLAGDPQHAAVLAELKRELERHLARLPGGFAELKPSR